MDHIPAPAVAGNCANCNHPTDQHHPRCPTRPYQGTHRAPSFPTEPQPASIFDAPPADREYAKAKAKALIAEFEMWVNSPGVVWDDAAAGAWMGQACTILAELAK